MDRDRRVCKGNKEGMKVKQRGMLGQSGKERNDQHCHMLQKEVLISIFRHPWPGIYLTSLFSCILKSFTAFAFSILHLKFYVFILWEVA